MNKNNKFGKLDASSKKELDSMERALKEKYDNLKKPEKAAPKIA